MSPSSHPPPRPPRVVAAFDFTPPAMLALRRAIAVADAQRAELHVVCVREITTLPPPVDNQIPAAALERLREVTAAEVAAATGLSRVVTHLLVGAAASEIAWLAAHLDADLIVVGTHGRKGVARLLLGSVAEKLTRIAGCPVFVERAKKHDPKVLIPEVEPLCPKCSEHRQATGGAELWCAEHAAHHLQAHVVSAGDRHSHPMSVRSWGFSN